MKNLIQIIEDDKSVKKLLEIAFKEFEFEFISSENKKNALLMFLSHNPNLLVVDLGLPDGDGKDFVNVSVEDMLKQNPDLILRTSHAMPEQVKEYFQQEFSNNETWQQFDAVKNNKVYDLNNEYFGMSANFNYQKGFEDLEGILYENN